MDGEKLCVIADFDRLGSIYATEDDIIYIKGYCNNDDDSLDTEDCTILLNKELFFKILQEWVRVKAKYSKTFNHLCGAGYVIFHEIEEITKEGKTRTFLCKNFEIDIEHG